MANRRWIPSCLIVLLAAGSSARGEEVKRMQPLLGTYVEIVAEGGSRTELDRAVDEGFEAFHRVDRLLSSYRGDSEVNRINRNAGIRPVGISEWTYQCLFDAVAVGRRSRGAFDVTCRPLLDLWGFLNGKYRVPSRAEIETARRLVGYRGLELATSPQGHRTAYLDRPGMTVDLGGIGKGFAVDKAVLSLKRAGVRSGRVRAWGDCFGFGDRDWKIQIEPGKTVVLRDKGVSTAGDYEKFFERGRHHYPHIVDPRTGRPVEGIRSVTVKADRCLESDAWSTALFVDPSLNPEGVEILFLERD